MELQLVSDIADELAELGEHELDQDQTRDDYLGVPGLTPDTRNRGKSRKKNELNEYEREHHEELDLEVKETKKHSRFG